MGKIMLDSNETGYILLSPEYIENVESYFQGFHLFDSKVDYDYEKDNNNKILYRTYEIKNTIPLCNNQNIHSIKEKFENFESIRKNFSYELVYSNKSFHFSANSIMIKEYYTDSKNTFYYSDKKAIIRAIASILGEIVCETCLTKLYTNTIENIPF